MSSFSVSPFFLFIELSQRISIIPLTEEGPSTKYLVYKQLFDTLKNLLSLSQNARFESSCFKVILESFSTDNDDDHDYEYEFSSCSQLYS